jgi:hypothetical protein
MSKYCTVCTMLVKKGVFPPQFPHPHDGENFSKGLAEKIEAASLASEHLTNTKASSS